MTGRNETKMRILQPAEWPKPRGFSHGVEFSAAGRWIVLAGQTGGDEQGDYPSEMAAQVGAALKRIVKLLAEARRRSGAHCAAKLVSDQPQRI
jgi:enamine deaminase RidA (YjgF/YER057c/UK114 family)